MTRVVVTRVLPDAALAELAPLGEVWVSGEDRALAPAELHDAVRGAEAVVTMLHDRVDDAFLDAAGPGLRVVANVAVGYDNVDVEACRRRGVVVTNTPGVLVDATADLAFALLLGVTRRVREGDALLRDRDAVDLVDVVHARHRAAGPPARRRRLRPDRAGRWRGARWRSG
jgi:lactate dehydrogenase-like 2-hydroxyacid dehydrogenase